MTLAFRVSARKSLYEQKFVARTPGPRQRDSLHFHSRHARANQHDLASSKVAFRIRHDLNYYHSFFSFFDFLYEIF